MRSVIAGAAVAAVALGGCATDANRNIPNDGLGTLESRLTLPDGQGSEFNIDTVDYFITGNGADQDGSINVANSSSLVFQVGDLPVADDYTMRLEATATRPDGSTEPCAGEAQFDITDTDVTTSAMTLICGGGVAELVDEAGDIHYTVSIEAGENAECPVVTGITALPAAVQVGFGVELEGFYLGTATLGWTSDSDGAFSAAAAAVTEYTCASEGVKTLTFTATGESDACTPSTQDVEIICEPAVVAEVCDNGVDDNGNGLVDCDEPSCATDPACEEPVETDCGDGVDNDGDGDVDCEDADCAGDAACQSGDACRECVDAACADYQGSGISLVDACFYEGAPFQGSPTPQPEFSQLCTDAYECSLNSPDDCFFDGQGPGRCLCGSRPISECQVQGPAEDAQCPTEWNAAATACDTGDWQCVVGQFTDFTQPSGYANFTIECTNANCTTECGFGG